MNANVNTNTKIPFTKVKMTSRNIISVVIFVIFVILVFYILWKIYKDYRSSQLGQPWLIRGTKIGRTFKTIPGHLLPFSSDSQYGTEFSYTFWLYITDWIYKSGEYKHIFHKGNDSAKPLQAPGVWLYPNENKMAINMNTFYSVKESCDIGNIPIAKWFHVAIVLIGRHLDIYINGRLRKRCKLRGIPNQNYGDLYINAWNGFDGFISKFRYYNFALPYYKIEQAFADGPSQQPCDGTGLPAPPYLAEDYWFGTGFPGSLTT